MVSLPFLLEPHPPQDTPQVQTLASGEASGPYLGVLGWSHEAGVYQGVSMH